MDIRALVEQIVSLYKNLNKPQKYAILATVVVVVSLIAFLVVFNLPSKKDDGFRPLYENLSQKDAGLIVQQLEKKQIEYKIPTDGTIEIKKELVNQTRMDMATQGLPKESKVGFELFDKQELGATDFDQRVKFIRAKEGEIARTIEIIDSIDSAKVQIALPKESVFVSKETPPTASVIIRLKEGMTLNKKQVSGIKFLVSGAVSKLTVENVKIVDEDGIPLGEEDASSAAGELARMQLRYKRDYEKIYEEKIVNMLGQFLGGADKVVAKVTAEFDFAQRDSVEEVFDPNNVPRSEQTLEEKREGYRPKEIGGVPGAVSNIGPVQGLEDKNVREKYSKNEATTNYEVSKRTSNVKGEFALLRRLTAAVVVDGKYTPKKDENGAVIDDEFVFEPLSDDEMERLTALVKNTVGFNAARADEISVSNFEFRVMRPAKKDGAMRFLDAVEAYLGPFYPFLKYLFIVLILVFFYKKVIVPFANRMMEVPTEEEEIPETTIEFDEEELEDNSDRLNELRKKVENQLGLGDNMDEEKMKYDILLERIRGIAEERIEEVSQLITSLVEDEIIKTGNR